MLKRRFVVLLGGAVFALSSAPALAQTPSEGGYGSTPIPPPPGQADASASNAPDGSHTPTARAAANTRHVSSPSARRLPFTGLDVRLVTLLGVGFLSTGLVLRRRTRTRTD